MNPGPQFHAPHACYKSVYLELNRALCSSAKHNGNHVGAIDACALY